MMKEDNKKPWYKIIIREPGTFPNQPLPILIAMRNPPLGRLSEFTIKNLPKGTKTACELIYSICRNIIALPADEIKNQIENDEIGLYFKSLDYSNVPNPPEFDIEFFQTELLRLCKIFIKIPNGNLEKKIIDNKINLHISFPEYRLSPWNIPSGYILQFEIS